MANPTATTIDQTAEKQLDTDTTQDKLTVTRENVEMVCQAAVKAGVKVSAEALCSNFTHPTSHKLRFYFAEWKEQNRDVINPGKDFYVKLAEAQAATINELGHKVDELTELLQVQAAEIERLTQVAFQPA